MKLKVRPTRQHAVKWRINHYDVPTFELYRGKPRGSKNLMIARISCEINLKQNNLPNNLG